MKKIFMLIFILLFIFNCQIAEDLKEKDSDEYIEETTYNEPGIYEVNNRYKVYLQFPTIFMIVSLESVEIFQDKTMKFNFKWTAYCGNTQYISKGSDSNNKNMYLKDDLGNRYDHYEVGGAAGKYIELNDLESATGWFLFPKADKNAKRFTFFDDDVNSFIDNITFKYKM